MLQWYISKASILRSLMKYYHLEQQQFAGMMIWSTIWRKTMIQGWAEIPTPLCDPWEFPRIMKGDGNSRSPLSWSGVTICQKEDLVKHFRERYSGAQFAKKDYLLQQFAKEMIWYKNLHSRRSSATRVSAFIYCFMKWGTMMAVSSPSSIELHPSQVSNLSSHQREPQEVDDTCISWRFSNRICRAD